jgi:murein DD-endopeptidase MepM/ murein hydrolase activator NlpD
MTTKTNPARRGVRLSRPDSDRFFTIMLVFSQRTFRWSLARKTILWTVGIVLGIWAVAMIGSAYGFWATKKIMSFSQLQQDTENQQRQLKESLSQAQGLEDQVKTLKHQVDELMKLINPATPIPEAPSSKPNQIGMPTPTTEKISQLKDEIERTWSQAKAMQARMDPIIDRWNHTPSIPPTAGYLSSGFGIRISPFSQPNEQDEGLLGFHTGYDISNAINTPIQVTANGIVESAGWQTGYGNAVVIRHTDELETLYGHLNQIDPKIKVGQQVSRGDIIGYMGQTGRATGVHLHYEVRVNSKPVDPGPYLRLQRQWLSSLK